MPQYIFYASIPKGNWFAIKNPIDTLQNKVTDVCVSITKTHFDFVCKDNKKPHHMTVRVSYTSKMYDEFKLKPTQLNIRIHIQHLYSNLKCVKKNDKIILYIESKSPDKLHIDIIKTSKDGKLLPPIAGIIPVTQVQPNEINEEDEEYQNHIMIPTEAYQEVVKSFNDINKSKIEIETKGEYIKFKSEVQNVLERKMEFGKLPADVNNIYTIKDSYNLKLLNNFIKILSLNKNIMISMGEDLCLRLSLVIQKSEKVKGGGKKNNDTKGEEENDVLGKMDIFINSYDETNRRN